MNRNRGQSFLLSIVALFLVSACVSMEVKPPPATGKIFTQQSMSVYNFSIKYSVGQLEDQLRLVGVIQNDYTSDLDHFKLTLRVVSPEDVEVAKAVTPTLYISDMDSQVFAFTLPLLHGPHTFKLDYEYDYYDFADMSDRPRFLRSETHDNGSFEDLIALP
ncbi:MAG: hypothetical protein U9N63_07830 [Pseudomonadota bacterium]|nr:hypothetical protein [Pseudomonadota bacterium]